MISVYWMAWRHRYRWWWRGLLVVAATLIVAGLWYRNAHLSRRTGASGKAVVVKIVPTAHGSEAEIGRLARVIPRRFAQHPEDAAGDAFGSGLAVAGDLLFVSAVSDDQLAQDCGAICVYRRDEESAVGWKPWGNVLPPEASVGLSFGCVMGAVNGTLVVWAAGEAVGDAQGSANAKGCVYLYRIDAGAPPETWEPYQTLRPEKPGTEFGRWGAVTDGWLAVGARSAVENGTSMPGTVTLYEQETGGNWHLRQTLFLPKLPVRSGFGPLVTIHGKAVAVAAFVDQTKADPPGPVIFRTHCFRYDPSAQRWRDDGMLPFTDLASFRVYLMSEDRLCVSGWHHDTTNRFVVRVFDRADDGWKQVGELYPDYHDIPSEFGSWLSSSGDSLLVGARNAQRLGVMHGAASLFELGPVGTEPLKVVSIRRLLPTEGHALSKFGEKVLLTEDQMLIGAPRFGGDFPRGGAVFVYER